MNSRVTYGPGGRGRPRSPVAAAVAHRLPVAECVAELETLFARFTALTEAGIRACAAGDDAALGAALDARDLVNTSADALVRGLVLDRQAASSNAAVAALDLALRPAWAAAEAAAEANAKLERQAHAARTVLGEQLDRLRHDDAARSAYTAAVGHGEPSRLDLTR
jgi:hypothetical protein